MSADSGVLQPGGLAPDLTRFALPVLASPDFGHSSWPGMTLLAMLVALLVGCAAFGAIGDKVACHIEYGGVSLMATSTPVASAYDVEPIRIDSAFLFRIVFQQQPTELASVKLYTYADKGGVPALIHQARFPYPLPRSEPSSFGFTGLQSVYEPVWEGELQYWCELEDAAVVAEVERSHHKRTEPSNGLQRSCWSACVPYQAARQLVQATALQAAPTAP